MRTEHAWGKLIVFEGAEGVGKSTQVALLLEALLEAGVPAVTFREPGGTDTGDVIRSLLLDPRSKLGAATEALLFMASRAELCEREIRPALARGAIVVLDRFFLSTYAYQIAGRGLPEGEVRAANALATGGLVPDLTVLLDLPGTTGLDRASSRGETDRMERSAEDFHARVASAFREYASGEWSALHPECGSIVRIDGSGPRDAVFARVAGELATRMPDAFGGLRAGLPAGTGRGKR